MYHFVITLIDLAYSGCYNWNWFTRISGRWPQVFYHCPNSGDAVVRSSFNLHRDLVRFMSRDALCEHPRRGSLVWYLYNSSKNKLSAPICLSQHLNETIVRVSTDSGRNNAFASSVELVHFAFYFGVFLVQYIRSITPKLLLFFFCIEQLLHSSLKW